MRSKLATISLFLVVMLLPWLGLGCQRQSSKQKIAFIVPTLANPFFVDMTNSAEQAAKTHPDIELMVQAPPAFTDVDQQVAMIENAITLKVGTICLVAADSKAVVPVLKKAQANRVPVLLVDNTVDPAAAKNLGLVIPPHIGSDNVLGGKLAAEFIGKALEGKGQVAMLEGVLGSDVANARKRGFLEGLAEFPGLRLVASQTANYSREQGLNVFQNMLEANPKLDALFAANDEMALGAVRALQESRIRRKIVIVGFDATADALAAVQKGEMAATIQQQPKEMGRIAVDLATHIMQSQVAPPETMVPVKLVTSAGS